MKILICGGCGFIGSHLCEHFLNSGNTVLCLDNFLSGNLVNVRHLLDNKQFKLIKGDIRDRNLLDRIVPGIDVIILLAAQVHVDRSYVEPELTWDINVSGTQKVLEAAKYHDVKRVVYASSSEVYGSAEYSPMDEHHPLNAPHPYGASKIAADRMCYAYQKTYGMDIMIARCFNTFGPRQRDYGYGGVISIFTKRILNGMPPIVYGSGTQTRDYLFIDDAVAAYDCMVRCDHRIEDAVNFGTGEEVSVNDLAVRLNSIAQRRFGDIIHAEARQSEVMRLVANWDRARAEFGWEPKTTLQKGLEKFVGWYSKYGQQDRITL